MAASSDPLFESLQRLQPMLDAFNKSASELCDNNKNKAEALAVVKDLEDYYGKLHKDLLSRYEILNQKETNTNTGEKKETNKNVGEKTPKSKAERKQEKDEAKKEENKGADRGGEKTFAGYSFPKILSVRVRPKMEWLCRESDGAGLRNYLVNNRRDHVKMNEELPGALSMAKDSAVLVLKAIEGYDFSESRTTGNDKKESYSSANRRACISLLECLFPLLGRDENAVVVKEVQDKAREIARVWKQNMGLDKRLDSVSKLDIQAFLQLLVTFRIGKDFDHDELSELLFRISRQKQSPAFALLLGLSAKMPDFVEKLSKFSKWIEAIRFSHAFGMVNKVNITDWLKAYLEDAEKDAKNMVKNGGGSESSRNNSTMREISAINVVIKIVKEYNMEHVYPLDDLQNKLQRLEQVKEIRKLAAERKLSKGQRHRANKKKAAAEKAGKEATVDIAEKKSAASTQEKNKSIAITPAKKNKAAEAKSDEKNSSIEKEQFKRPHSSEPGSGNVGLIGAQGPADSGLYRPSQRAKYASEWKMNSSAGDKGMVPHGTGLFQSNHGISRDDRYLSYHGDNTSATGPSMYGSGHTGAFATPPATGTQINERRGSDGYPSAFGSSKTNPVGSSFYGTSAAAGALAGSSFNAAQINYDGRGLQSYTPAFGSVDKNSLGSSMYDIDDFVNSSGSKEQGKYERRGPEINTSAFGGDNLSNVGSLVYGSNRSSDPNNWTEKRFQEQYMPNLGGGNMHPIDSSVYGSRASAVPSSNVYGSGTSTVPSTNVYGAGTSTVPSSNVYGAGAGERRELEQRNPGFASSIRSDYGSMASAGGPTGQSALNRYQFNSGIRF